ncbi:MAG: hypothetical protein JXA57_13600 [Armatimonadetes bacterium]|nr:hypothetical protein [Armatimonadota bacterium]
MSSCLRQSVIDFFLERKLLDQRRAKKMLDWTHSGFRVDASIRIPWPSAGSGPARGPAGSAKSREALAQCVVRGRGTWSRRPHLVRLAPQGLDAWELEARPSARAMGPHRLA